MKAVYLILGFIVTWIILATIIFFIIAVITGLVYAAHDHLIKKKWYRITFSTLTYPFLKWKIKQAWLLKSPSEIINDWTKYLTGSNELIDSGSWYQKSLEKYVIKKFVEPALKHDGKS
ncbi:MAG: hypothetical protein PHR19_08260 [Bacteroidales bacterium]|nr:hypothetical protein [Bacteroidales bacterium]